VELEDPVYNGDVSAVNLEDDNLPHSDVLLLVVSEKEQVASLKQKKCYRYSTRKSIVVYLDPAENLLSYLPTRLPVTF
jgi:hypothetical protein